MFTQPALPLFFYTLPFSEFFSASAGARFTILCRRLVTNGRLSVGRDSGISSQSTVTQFVTHRRRSGEAASVRTKIRKKSSSAP